MQKTPTGNEIVEQLASGRPWWSLRASDIDLWVKSLHPSATRDLASRTEWIGEPWDGVSDISLGHTIIAGTKVKRLLTELREAIRRLGLAGVALPDARSVRDNLSNAAGHHTLTFDVDMGDFILPLGVEDWMLRRDEQQSCKAIADRMAAHVLMADAKRPQITAREKRLRHAVEETAASIGEGVAPLWLRMGASPCHEEPKHVTSHQYVMLFVILNDCLRWSPVGTERIWTVKDVRDHRAWYAKTQRRRAGALAALEAIGSEGYISEIALAMIQEQGLDPAETFRQAVAARLADQRGAVEFKRNGCAEQLYYVDGTLHAAFGFNGGHYSPGSLTIWGDWPEQLAIGARRRPLSAYVDHPAFVSTAVTVTKAGVRRGAMDLDHDVRLHPVEALVDAPPAPSRALAA